jgi:hypothetical protein
MATDMGRVALEINQLFDRIFAPMDSNTTPLSNVITRYVANPRERFFEEFVDAFMEASVGVVAIGLPPGPHTAYIVGKNEKIGLGNHVLPDGRKTVLAFADPVAFQQRYGGPMNAMMVGAVIMNVALANPTCQGICINSAASEHRVVIGRSTIESRLGLFPTNPATDRPWWKFWA